MGIANFVPQGAKSIGFDTLLSRARELKGTERGVVSGSGGCIHAGYGERPEIQFVRAQASGAGEYSQPGNRKGGCETNVHFAWLKKTTGDAAIHRSRSLR